MLENKLYNIHESSFVSDDDYNYHIQLGGGNDHVIIYTQNGFLYGIGNNNENKMGLNELNKHKKVDYVTEPTMINSVPLNNNHVKQIVCGMNFSAILLDNGKIYIMGLFYSGFFDSDRSDVYEFPTLINKNNIIFNRKFGGYDRLFPMTENNEIYAIGGMKKENLD